MNKEKIFQRLKTKAASLGFAQAELRSIAETISNNPTLTEDAGEAEIDPLIDQVLPFLQAGQKMATRLVNQAKPTPTPTQTEVIGPPAPTPPSNSTTPPTPTDPNTQALNAVLESLKGLKDEIATLKSERTAGTRRSQLESLLKDKGTYGQRVLKSFDRMTFANEEEFTEFLTEIQEEAKTVGADPANPTPMTPQTGTNTTGKEDVANQASIDSVASLFNPNL